MWKAGRLFLIVVATLPLAGCAVHGRPASTAPIPQERPAVDQPAPLPPAQDSLDTHIEKVRALAAQARTRPRPNRAVSVEAWDRELAAALLAATVFPCPDNERAAASEYRRLGVLDRALQHLTLAIRMDPTDSEAYDGLARIWRDWGLPHIALADAHRAVYYAPQSAAAHNTLGTVLLALGDAKGATERFERAYRLNPRAGYALNNLCYTRLLEGDLKAALNTCRQAVELAPDLTAARNNLGLAYAASGDLEAASREFDAAGDKAAGQYNLGIVSLASRRFETAAAAFDAASRLRPSFALARERAAQARHLASLEPEGGTLDERR
jgi:tetratricopeptide (TPR) repeat protein